MGQGNEMFNLPLVRYRNQENITLAYEIEFVHVRIQLNVLSVLSGYIRYVVV